MELLEYLDSWLSEKIKIKESEKKIDSYTVINITETAIEAELKELPILYKDTEYKLLAFTLDENNLNESMKLSPIYTRTLIILVMQYFLYKKKIITKIYIYFILS